MGDNNRDGTRVVCNPRGYTPVVLNPDFLANLVVEVLIPFDGLLVISPNWALKCQNGDCITRN